jgi:hypothetical protein
MKAIDHIMGVGDLTAIHGENPVEDFYARGHRDDHGHDAEDGVYVAAGAHGEEMVQPDHEGEQADGHRRHHHGAIAEQGFFREGGDDFGEDAEGGQDQDIDLRMAPGPDQIHEHHDVAAAVIGEEVEAQIAIQQQHGQGGGQDREGGDDQQIGGQSGPAEHRHAQIGHAGGMDLQHGGDEIDAG